MAGSDPLYAIKVKSLWQQFWKEGFSFWMICGYLFFEYVRPQSIYNSIDILPWTFLFIVLSFVGLAFDKNRKWVSDPVNKWMIIFLIVIVISSINAYWPAISFERLEFIYTWIIIYFLIINIVNTPSRFYIFFLLFCFASFKLSLHGAHVWVSRGFGFAGWGITGPPGFFQNSGELSIQMLVFFPLGFYLYQSLKDRVRVWEKIILILFFVTPVMTILGASSRGAQIALLVQIAVMFYRKIFKVKTLAFVAILIYLGMTFLPQEQKDRFTTIGDDQTSQQRLLYWENGIEMIKDHPYLGVGYWNFIPYYESNYRDDMLYRNAELPHNIFIQIGTDAGLIGLSIYLVLMARFFRNRKSYSDPISNSIYKGLYVGFIGFVVAGQFVTVGYYPFMWIGLALLVSLQNSFRPRNT
ncbi:O-antigen ligase family protein [Marinimicrobium sp. ARAG 43.8]|uniref:O-antigen ligase family protein n=1 Tax=Marinimicrobium sp. ARAG 43.8 TaxID=3418719 RepID=UPI003CECF05F